MLIKTKVVSFHTVDSKPVKQEVNGTVILPPLVFPAPSSPWVIYKIFLKIKIWTLDGAREVERKVFELKDLSCGAAK